MIIKIGGGFIALCVAFIIFAYSYQLLTGKDLSGDASSPHDGDAAILKESPQRSYGDPNSTKQLASATGSSWNGYTIAGEIPAACKNKEFPSNRVIEDEVNRENAKYGSSRWNIDRDLAFSGDYSFNSIAQTDDGNCQIDITITGVEDGSSFSDDFTVTLP